MVSEGSLQTYFKAQCLKNNILWRKMAFIGRRGCPDVFIAWGGKIILVELKSPSGKGKLSELQKREIQHLIDVGVSVRVINQRIEVDDIIKEITCGVGPIEGRAPLSSKHPLR